MKRVLFISMFMIGLVSMSYGQVKPGDKAPAFNLKNVDGKMVALSDYADTKGVILIFTCNPCPFAKAYEDRIIKLHNGFSPEGYPVVAINPNDETVSPDDTFEKMKERATSKNFPFAYLKDEDGVFKKYGATRTPHVFLLDNDGKGNFTVAYIGAIDDNAMDAKSANENYVRNAIIALEQGKKPSPAQVKAIGCTIKMKK